MAKTVEKMGKTRCRQKVRSAKKFKPEAPSQAKQQPRPRGTVSKTQREAHTEATKKPSDPGEPISQSRTSSRKETVLWPVSVRLRGHDLSLLPAGTTDRESLRREAEHFDGAVSSWEKVGIFETMTSMWGRFVVQYDQADVDEAGVPRAVIGITEEILSCEYKEEEELVDEKRKGTDVMKPSTLGKRGRDEPPSLIQPPAEKRRWVSDDSDSESDTDADEHDEPPDWTEYENSPIPAPSHREPTSVLDTRVEFAKIDIIPADVYEAAYETENPLPRPQDYLIRGQAVPEMGV